MADTNYRVKKDYDSSMDSKYYFTASQLGATTSVQVANQIGELNSRLNQGLRAVEIGAMNQRILDQVPKEHFTEIKRLSELTGAKPSIHAPIQDLDLAGFTQQGWDPFEQERSIQKLGSVIERAHMMDPNGNVPITIHGGGGAVQRWKSEGLFKEVRDEEGEPKIVPSPDSRSEMTLVNQHTGQMQGVRYKMRKYVGREEEVPWTPERQMDNMNKTSWDREKFELLDYKKKMDEKERMTHQLLVQENYPALLERHKTKTLLPGDEERLMRVENELQDDFTFKNETYQVIRSSVEDMYERFEKYPYKKGPEATDAQIYKKNIYPKFKEQFEEGKKKIEKVSEEYQQIREKVAKNPTAMDQLLKKREELNKLYNDQTEILRRSTSDMPAPRLWQPVEEFSKEKVSTSVAEAAAKAFNTYGKNTPMVLLENVYPEFALSRAESLKETIEEARKKFVEKLKEKLGEPEAKKQAEKLIGATWDVGHIYQLRKSGYTNEQIEEEARKIGPFVKHLHITDNFGFEDSHLPPGLGEVNIKEQLKAIEMKQGEEKFRELRGIVEAGEFVANYKEVPHLYALSHFNSPLYVDDAGPRWDQIWESQGHYPGGYGEFLPQKYFDLYGSPGFIQLPAALGGGGGRAPDRGRFASAAGGEEGEEGI